ncbi:Ig-like domain-containing protein [Acholeplasma sp. OttesenSCG-928-E16]|nr:Ig-like domain-containing protein [Acholeplasma sp. OttesenSCG-928-E16]
MKRKVFLAIAVLVTSLLVGCGSKITIECSERSATIGSFETYQIEATTNDDKGLNYESENKDVATVNDSGLVSAVAVGQAKIKVSSKSDPKVSITIDIKVEKKDYVNVTTTEIDLDLGDEHTLVYDASGAVNFTSSDTNIAAVNTSGIIVSIAAGTVDITISLKTDASVSKVVKVNVVPLASKIVISGPTVITVGGTGEYKITATPAGSSKNVEWEVSDESIATINESGVLSGVTAGTVTVSATHKKDSTVKNSFEVEVKSILFVSASKGAGDTLTINGITLEHGKGLYSSLKEASEKAIDGTIIYLFDGEFSDAININKDFVSLLGVGNGAVIKNTVTIKGKNISIEGVRFEGAARIVSTEAVENLQLVNNSFNNITGTSDLISLAGVNGLVIKGNNITLPSINGIVLSNISANEALIRNNTITGGQTAIKAAFLGSATSTTQLHIVRNVISNANLPLDVNTLNSSSSYARYNQISGFGSKAVVANSENAMDFSLNYWGSKTVDISKFDNVAEHFLAGTYESADDILLEKYEDPRVPAMMIINNPIEDLKIGDSYQIEVSYLPYDYQHRSSNVRFVTTDASVAYFGLTGVLNIVKSGLVHLGVRSTVFTNLENMMIVSVLTDPGVEMKPSNMDAGLIVGEALSFETKVFPYTIENNPIRFSSSDASVATIDATGKVTSLKAGTVTFKAEVDVKDEQGVLLETVETTYTSSFYAELDGNNILDYLTMYHNTYAQTKNVFVNGFNGTYTYYGILSASMFLYDEVIIHQAIITNPAIRPGLMTALPSNVTPFNGDNIYWVVVHDTANAGSGAAGHAQWLSGGGDSTSWHYTVDDKETYQHLPENERAYHAGDGSSSPGNNGGYLGGGNRNGIGIETSVRKGDDLFKVWQNTAKLVADILVRNNLPLNHAKYHNDFSGKNCPAAMRDAKMIPYFEILKEVEYNIRSKYPDAVITLTSNNTDYLANSGRIIKLPEKAMTVTYTVSVTNNSQTETRDFAIYLPGTIA